MPGIIMYPSIPHYLHCLVGCSRRMSCKHPVSLAALIGNLSDGIFLHCSDSLPLILFPKIWEKQNLPLPIKELSFMTLKYIHKNG